MELTLSLAVSSTGSGLIVHWVGRYRECILFGWIIWAVGLGLFSTLDKHSGLGKQIGYGILTGVGVGNTLQPYVVAQLGWHSLTFPQIAYCRASWRGETRYGRGDLVQKVNTHLESMESVQILTSYSFVRNLGGTLGLAIAGTVM